LFYQETMTQPFLPFALPENVLVTGASGFVGKALCSALLAEGVSVRAAVRSSNSISAIAGLQVAAVGEIGAQTDWSAALADVDCVIHCAARAHVMQETEADAQVSINVH
jgi:nucleoside-diphosphate-sugar epimerase